MQMGIRSFKTFKISDSTFTKRIYFSVREIENV